MIKKFISISLLVMLLAACGAEAPVGPETVEPAPVESPDSYPLPLPTLPSPPSAYPGPDEPVSPGSPDPYPSPLDPLPGEESMDRGEAFVDDIQLLVMESFPPQYLLQVRGSLPTPCHNLRADISEPDAQNRIDIVLFSLVDPDMTCIQVLESFQTGINLGSFPQGSYTVLLNGEQVAEFEAP
jgi:hypothetical protein